MTAVIASYRHGTLAINSFNVEVPTIVVERAIYFPIRALCRIVGVDAQTQIYRIRDDSRMSDGLRILPVPTTKGVRDTACIHRTTAAIWLTTIDPARCAITARGPLTAFQSELFAAADRFLFGDHTPGVTNSPITYGTITAGDCPRCGAHLVLHVTGTGTHLQEVQD